MMTDVKWTPEVGMPSSKRNNAVSKAQRELYTRILDSDFLVFQIDGLVVLKVNNGLFSYLFFMCFC